MLHGHGMVEGALGGPFREGPGAMGHLVGCGGQGIQDEDALVGVQVGRPQLPQQGIPSRQGLLGQQAHQRPAQYDSLDMIMLPNESLQLCLVSESYPPETCLKSYHLESR